MTAMPTLTLAEARHVLIKLSSRMADAMAALHHLSGLRFWLDADKATHGIAESLFFRPGYTYCINYLSAEELADELVDELKDSFEVDTRDGLRCFVIRPFSGHNIDYSNELGLGYLMSIGGVHRKWRNIPSHPLFEPGGPVSGLSTFEEQVLVRALHAQSVSFFNTLTDMAVSVSYSLRAYRKEFGAQIPEFIVAEDPGIEAALEKLKAAVTLPGVTSPKFFSSANQDVKALPEAFLAHILSA